MRQCVIPNTKQGTDQDKLGPEGRQGTFHHDKPSDPASRRGVSADIGGKYFPFVLIDSLASCKTNEMEHGGARSIGDSLRVQLSTLLRNSGNRPKVQMLARQASGCPNNARACNVESSMTWHEPYQKATMIMIDVYEVVEVQENWFDRPTMPEDAR